MAGDLADSFKVVKKFETLIEAKSSEDIEKGEGVPNMTPSLPPPLPPPPQSMFFQFLLFILYFYFYFLELTSVHIKRL